MTGDAKDMVLWRVVLGSIIGRKENNFVMYAVASDAIEAMELALAFNGVEDNEVLEIKLFDLTVVLSKKIKRAESGLAVHVEDNL